MKYLTSLLALTAALFLAGCGILTKPVVTREAITIPGSTNVVIATNFPPQTVSLAITNDVVTYITNTPPPIVVTHTIIQPPTTGFVNVTNWIPNPDLLGALATAKEVNGAVNITPTSAPINLGISALAGLAALVAAWQNRKSNKATDVASTIISAIEKLPPDVANVIKPAVQAAGIRAGVADDIHDAVQRITT